MRRFDLYGLATQSVEAQDAETLRALEAYARGVNAWLAQVNEARAGARGAGILSVRPEIAVWQPADSIAIIKLMALQLSAHLEAEVLRARLSMLLPPTGCATSCPTIPGRASPRCRISQRCCRCPAQPRGAGYSRRPAVALSAPGLWPGRRTPGRHAQPRGGGRVASGQ
jgi:acyl-homoserine lactone acylase PvdQ